MDAIKSKMGHLEKTNAELVKKNEVMEKEKDSHANQQKQFKDTMVKGVCSRVRWCVRVLVSRLVERLMLHKHFAKASYTCMNE